MDFPLYDELKRVFFKTLGAGDVIRESLSGLERIELCFIYGSFAKGQEHPGSDIDIMIVGSISDKKLSSVFSKVEKGDRAHPSIYEQKNEPLWFPFTLFFSFNPSYDYSLHSRKSAYGGYYPV
ncbi:MAG: nucleotidyltransferase domain-containing protein [Actinomycetota bacterium]|nr:nucleotidyltransferase domain-containing protein [Actinomycetota bacterium]